jgi:DNA-binding transcriptional MerR regulator
MEYTIGEVAERSDLSIHTLRYYDKEGLLPFVKRTESGIRKFDDADLEGLKVIECLKRTGMPLRDIKQFLDWCQAGDETLQKRRNLFYERRAAVLEQMAELQKTLDTINFKCWYYETAVKEGSENASKNMPPSEMPEDIRALYEGTMSK